MQQQQQQQQPHHLQPANLIRISPGTALANEPGHLVTSGAPYGYTFGQLPVQSMAAGRPLGEDRVAMETLQIQQSPTPESSNPQEAAKRSIENWKNDKLSFISWTGLSVIFTALYIIVLDGLYLALGAGVIFTYFAAVFYFSPCYASKNGSFIIFFCIVSSFVADLILAFLCLVFGLHDATILACSVLILCHGSTSFMLFHKHQHVLAAIERLETPHREQTTIHQFQNEP
eukprot:g7373.t1